jgi:hypothetical protein
MTDYKEFCEEVDINSELQDGILSYSKKYPDMCMMCSTEDTTQGDVCEECGYKNTDNKGKPFDFKYAYFLVLLASGIVNTMCTCCNTKLTCKWVEKKNIWIGYCDVCKKIR